MGCIFSSCQDDEFRSYDSHDSSTHDVPYSNLASRFDDSSGLFGAGPSPGDPVRRAPSNYYSPTAPLGPEQLTRRLTVSRQCPYRQTK